MNTQLNARHNADLLTSTLAANHAALSPVALDFIQYALQHEGDDAPRQVDPDGQPLLAKNYPFELQPVPILMSRAKSLEWGKAAVDLFKIYTDLVTKLAKSAPELLAQYFHSGCADTLEYTFGGHTGLEYCMARGDFLATAEGFKLLEFNVSGNLGGWGIYLFEEMYRNDPLVKSFLASRKLEFAIHPPLKQLVMHIIGVTMQYCKGGQMPNIAVLVDSPERLGEAQDMTERIKRQVKAQAGMDIGYSCCASVNDFTLIDGDIHTPTGKVDSLLLFDFANVLPEFIHHKNRQNEFPIFDTRAAEILSQKSGLCLLSEYAHWDQCSEADKQLIEAHLPWTRFVKAGTVDYHGQPYDLEQLLISHQQQWVIKPTDGYQGIGVSVGNRQSSEQWQSAINEALSVPGKYIVQEFCLSLRYLAKNPDGGFGEHDAVWGPFVFGGQYAGNSVRLAPSDNDTGVINAHRGAKDAFIFLHD